jgi:hypothetical protein
MRLRKDAVDRITTDLQKLGLASCSVCDSAALQVDRRPIWMYVGGSPEARDATTNVIFLMRVFCEICGHSMLFDTEKYVHGDEKIFESP